MNEALTSPSQQKSGKSGVGGKDGPVLRPAESAQRVLGGDYSPLPGAYKADEVKYVAFPAEGRGLPRRHDMPVAPNGTSLTDRLNENPKRQYRETIPFTLSEEYGESVEVMHKGIPPGLNLSQKLDMLLKTVNYGSDKPGSLYLTAFQIDRTRGVTDTRVRQIGVSRMGSEDYLLAQLPDGSLAVYHGGHAKGIYTQNQLQNGGIFIGDEFYLTRLDPTTHQIEVGRGSVEGGKNPEKKPNPLGQDWQFRIATTLLSVGYPESVLYKVLYEAYQKAKDRNDEDPDKDPKDGKGGRWLRRMSKFLLPLQLIQVLTLSGDAGPAKPVEALHSLEPGQATSVQTVPEGLQEGLRGLVVPLEISDEPFRQPDQDNTITVEAGMLLDNIVAARLRKFGFDEKLRQELIQRGVISDQNTVEDQRKYDLVWQRLIVLGRGLYLQLNANQLPESPHVLRVGQRIYQATSNTLGGMYRAFRGNNFGMSGPDFGQTNRNPNGSGGKLGVYERYANDAYLQTLGGMAGGASDTPRVSGDGRDVVQVVKIPN